MTESPAELVKNLLMAEPQPIPDDMATTSAMIDHAFEFAKSMLIGERTTGDDPSFCPQWTVLTDKGAVAVLATPFDGEESKNYAAAVVATVIGLSGVIRYTFASEVWTAKGKPGEVDLATPPSQQPDRREMLMITGGDRKNGEMAKFWNIVRNRKGQIVDLPFDHEMPHGSMQGRFSGMLAPAN